MTIILDSDERKIIFATEGKSSDTIRAFREHLEQYQGSPKQIEEYCSDMSPAFIRGTVKEFPSAELTVDNFHVMKLINDVVDEVRREEQREQSDLKKSRYLWLRNSKDLTPEQQGETQDFEPVELENRSGLPLKARLYLWKRPALLADLYLSMWYQWALHTASHRSSK